MKKRVKKMAILARSTPGFVGGALLAMLITVSPAYAGWLVEDQELKGSDVVFEDLPGPAFGENVVVSGDTAVVSAHLHNHQTYSGTVYVFVRSGTTWNEQAKLKASDGEWSAYFGSSIAISGDMIVVGASGQEVAGAAEESGKTYIFTRNGTTWSEQSKLELPVSDREAYNHFGGWVAVSEDTVVVTAEEVGNSSFGVAYVFSRSGTTWTESVRLDDVAFRYYSRPPIAISGNTIVVGKRDSTSVLVRSGTTWSKQADLTDIGSFAISDDTIAVGVPDESVVHIFTRTESTWSKQDTLIGYAPDSNPNPDSLIYVQFGYSVAISGDTIVVGEPGMGGWYHDRKVHVFTREKSTWKEQVALVPTELNGFLVEFGSSVAIDGNTVVVGSRDGETFFSSAYVYDLTCDATYSLPSNQWRQISLPCNPGANDSVTSVLGDDIPGTYGTDWRLYRYDANGYIALTAIDSLSQGVGYWVIQTSGDDRILDMPDNSTPTPDFSTDSYPTSHSKACFEFDTVKGCFPIPLATQANAVQWNMIGYPFISAGALGNARIQTDADSCASGCDLDTAHSQGIVHNQLWTFNGTHYEVVDTSGNLEPWGGYWLATLQSAEGLNPRLLLAKP